MNGWLPMMTTDSRNVSDDEIKAAETFLHERARLLAEEQKPAEPAPPIPSTAQGVSSVAHLHAVRDQLAAAQSESERHRLLTGQVIPTTY